MRLFKKPEIFITLVTLLACSTFAFAQAPTPTSAPTPEITKTAAPDQAARIRRWLEVGTLFVSTRYRYIEAQNGSVTANQDQYQIAARFKFKFDAKGRYGIVAGLETGNFFSFGWNNSGWGTGSASKKFNARQFYFDAKPVSGLEFQVGSLGFNNGENTETTGYDIDGYLVGERVQIRDPKRLYFDEISATNGYVGDVFQLNAFRRLHRLSQSNYRQFLVRKQFNKSVGFSADYTFDSGVDTLRQAVKFTLPQRKALDFVLFENYQRLDPDPGYGFNIYGQKKLNKVFTFGGGFARIDRVMLNADRFPPGNRLYVNSIINLSRELSVTTSYTEGFGDVLPNLAQRRLDVVLSYNILETLHRLKLN